MLVRVQPGVIVQGIFSHEGKKITWTLYGGGAFTANYLNRVMFTCPSGVLYFNFDGTYTKLKSYYSKELGVRKLKDGFGVYQKTDVGVKLLAKVKV